MILISQELELKESKNENPYTGTGESYDDKLLPPNPVNYQKLFSASNLSTLKNTLQEVQKHGEPARIKQKSNQKRIKTAKHPK